MKDDFSPKNLARRAKAKTPEFHRKVRNIGMLLASICGVILTIATAGVALPAAVVTIATIGGAVGTAMAGQAQLAKTEPEPKPEPASKAE